MKAHCVIKLTVKASASLAAKVSNNTSGLLQLYLIYFYLDNNMINGTKLLNVAGMSRGKRDGILKNERGRIVVKVGAMHLKGVW
jgi:hypothetical protein